MMTSQFLVSRRPTGFLCRELGRETSSEEFTLHLKSLVLTKLSSDKLLQQCRTLKAMAFTPGLQQTTGHKSKGRKYTENILGALISAFLAKLT